MTSESWYAIVQLLSFQFLNKGKSLTTVENELCNIRCYFLIQLAMHDHQFEVH
jgi:hypothetical protein